MGWKFFGPTADSGESAVGVCRGSPTADAIFEFVKGSFVVSFTAPSLSVRTVRSIQIFPVGSIQICDKFVTNGLPSIRKGCQKNTDQEVD